MKAVKGFDKDLKCRDFQFEVGQTYTHTAPVVACESGFHAIPEDVHPLAVFDYYAPAGSRFCEVTVGGKTDSESDKVAAEVLAVEREITLADLTQRAVAWVMARAKPEGDVARRDNGAATASGYHGAATASGRQGAATASGDKGAATASGDKGAATASGDKGAATASGDKGAATASGTRGAATASGTRGAAAASGHYGAATASGWQGAATASGRHGAATASGDQGAAAASGHHGAAMATGPFGRVRGDVDNVDLFAREFVLRDGKYHRVSIACGTTGMDGIRAGVWYVCRDGKLVEAE